MRSPDNPGPGAQWRKELDVKQMFMFKNLYIPEAPAENVDALQALQRVLKLVWAEHERLGQGVCPFIIDR